MWQNHKYFHLILVKRRNEIADEHGICGWRFNYFLLWKEFSFLFYFFFQSANRWIATDLVRCCFCFLQSFWRSFRIRILSDGVFLCLCIVVARSGGSVWWDLCISLLRFHRVTLRETKEQKKEMNKQRRMSKTFAHN